MSTSTLTPTPLHNQQRAFNAITNLAMLPQSVLPRSAGIDSSAPQKAADITSRLVLRVAASNAPPKEALQPPTTEDILAREVRIRERHALKDRRTVLTEVRQFGKDKLSDSHKVAFMRLANLTHNLSKIVIKSNLALKDTPPDTLMSLWDKKNMDYKIAQLPKNIAQAFNIRTREGTKRIYIYQSMADVIRDLGKVFKTNAEHEVNRKLAELEKRISSIIALMKENLINIKWVDSEKDMLIKLLNVLKDIPSQLLKRSTT